MPKKRSRTEIRNIAERKDRVKKKARMERLGMEYKPPTQKKAGKGKGKMKG